MYINLKLFEKSNLSAEQLISLLAVKQKEQIYIKEEFLDTFEELDLITFIKAKNKSQNRLELVRLSDKGKKLLNSIITEPVAGETEDILFEWLSKYYIEKGKEVGNPNRVKKLLKWFSEETGIYKNDLIKLFIDFLKDEYVDEASRVLEFTLFYPKKFTTDKGKTIAYEAKPDIFDSWLFTHFQKNRERLINTFEDYNLKITD